MATRRRYGAPPRPSQQAPRPEPGPRPERPAPPVQRKRPPPFPTFLLGAVGFVVLLFLSIGLDYFSATYPYMATLAVLLFIFALLCALLSVYFAFQYNDQHRSDFPGRARIATLCALGLLLGGTIAGSITFVMLEPYHAWSYSARLDCEGSCIVDLPVPMRAPHSNRTFFDEKEVTTTGQGYVEVVQQYQNGSPVPALRVHWSGNFTVKAGQGKDYRNLTTDRNGLYDPGLDRFYAIGRQVLANASADLRVELNHRYVSQVPRSDHWMVQGPVGPGMNGYAPERP